MCAVGDLRRSRSESRAQRPVWSVAVSARALPF